MHKICLIVLASLAAASPSHAYPPKRDAVVEYTVPVAPGLEPYARFTLHRATYTEADGRVTVQYDLPPELVGAAKTTVRFEGQAQHPGQIRLHGDAGDATCSDSGSTMTCKMDYNGLRIVPGAADQFLVNTVTDPVELSARREVAASFMSDPVGNVTYRYR